jgi:23S rRNA pseudouridine2605 synthase
MTKIRLNRVISQDGIASVREADELIRQGRVLINGVVETGLGFMVDPRIDHIMVDGEPIGGHKKKHYYLFFKPKNVVSTMDDPERRPSISDFTQSLSVRVFPAGRLDFDADGLMLLTNDGQVANLAMHPRSKVPKTYQVKVAGALAENELIRFRAGISIERKRTLPARIIPLEVRPSNAWYEVTLAEGRNRQIKKMFAFFRKRVLKIRRVAIGPLSLEGLAPGEVRKLTARESELLFSALGITEET